MNRAGEGQLSLFPPEPAPDPLLCWLWLAGTLGAGSLRAGAVLDAFGGAQEAWEALRLPEADAPEASGQMLYYQPPDEQCARNGYDTLLEHEITAAVTACKAKEVRHLLERFTAKMLEKNIRGYERQFYIQRLVAAMLAVAENAGLSVNQVLADRYVIIV